MGGGARAIPDAARSLLTEPDLAAVWDALPEARVVGGAVRDSLLGRLVADVDLATPRRPDAVIDALEAAGLRAVPTGLRHGTVTAVADGRGFEVTTLRRDLATDGRHATVAFTDDWRQDAARRDLTFNAMSIDRAGTVFDYFGGRDDLLAGRARFVGDPATRIAEDFLRVLRYFRFLARYARVPPDPATLEALGAGVPGLARLSPERVWSEIKRILLAADPRAALRLMRRLGVLAAVLPEASGPERLEALVAAGASSDPLLRVAALAGPESGRGLARRLRLSNLEAARLSLLWAPEPRLTESSSDADIRRALSLPGVTADSLVQRTWLHGEGPALRARIAAMPSPGLGQTLRALEQHWRDNGCVATRAELVARLPTLAMT